MNNSVRCPQCRLLNFATESICKRCRAPLAADGGFAAETHVTPNPHAGDEGVPHDGPHAGEWGAGDGEAQAWSHEAAPDEVAPPRASAFRSPLVWVGVLVLAFAAGLAVWRVAGRLKWKEYRHPDGSFSVMMPGKPLESTTSQPAPFGTLQMNSLTSLRETNAGYVLVYSDYPDAVVNSGVTDDQLLEGGLQGGLKSSGAKLVRRAKVSLGNYSGIEADLQAPPSAGVSSMRCRVYWMPPRLYILMAISPTADPNTAEAQKFLDSFKVLRHNATRASLP